MRSSPKSDLPSLESCFAQQYLLPCQNNQQHQIDTGHEKKQHELRIELKIEEGQREVEGAADDKCG